MEVVQDFIDLLIGGAVLGCPSDHPGLIVLLPINRVGNVSHLIWIAS